MKCKFEGCPVTKALFAYSKSDELRFCKTHSDADMVNVVSKQCLEPNCDKRPKFNLPGIKGGIYCKDHAFDDMINVDSKKCLNLTCTKQAKFNLPEVKSGIYCSDHALDNMIDVASKKCLKCTKRPSFNLPGEKGGIYCIDHASDTMVDVVSKKCLDQNCTNRPLFNLPGLKKGLYCSDHALDDMIDVVSKKCIKCTKRPSFNYPGLKIRLYCVDHSLDGMVNIKNKQCVLCNIVTARTHYQDHCSGCFSFKFPNDPRVTNFKTKEGAIMSEIAKVYPEIILDKIISGGCSRKRPDGLIDLLTHCIIIEVDENQHKGYDTMCDNKRTMSISQDLAHRPIVFIRVNPDKYKVAKKTVNGAFSLTTETGKLKVHKDILKKRVDATLSLIEQYTKIVPKKTITVESLFFDDYQSVSE